MDVACLSKPSTAPRCKRPKGASLNSSLALLKVGVTLEIGAHQLATGAIVNAFRIGDLDAVLDVLETNFEARAYPVDRHDIELESTSRH